MSHRLRGYCHVCTKEVDAQEAADGELMCRECNEAGCVERLNGPSTGTSTRGPGSAAPGPAQAGSGGYGFGGAPQSVPGVANFMPGFPGGMTGSPPMPGFLGNMPGFPGNMPGFPDANATGLPAMPGFPGNMMGFPDANAIFQQYQGFHQQVVARMEATSQEADRFVNNVAFWAERNADLVRDRALAVPFLAERLGENWQEQVSGHGENSVRKWVDEHATERVGPDSNAPGATDEPWACPICYKGHEPGGDGLCLLCDGDGRNWHVFHKDCALTWLGLNDSCPMCRRSPIIGRA